MPKQQCGMSFEGNPADGFVSGDLEILDDVEIGQDLTIQGNLTVLGTQTTIDTEQLVVEDPLVVVGKDNQADLNDGGVIIEYDAGTSARYAGLIRDKSDSSGGGKKFWKLVDNLTSQPSTTANNTTTYESNLTDLKLRNLTISTNLTSNSINNQFELLTGSLDARSSADLLIGSSLATRVKIAKSVVPTDIEGQLFIDRRIDSISGNALIFGGLSGSSVILARTGIDTRIKGTLEVQQVIDRETSGQLDIGTATATTVNISRTGQTTNIKGTLDVQQVIDRETAGELDIGTSTATSVNISGLNDTTTIKGGLQVDQTINATGKLTALNFGDDSNRNLFIGEINDPTPTGTDNISIGQNNGEALTSGGSNVLIGNNVGSSIDIGSKNLCIGFQTGDNIINALENTLVGIEAGENVNGSNNTAVGLRALGGNAPSINTGTSNTAIGVNSLDRLISGTSNTCIGGGTGRIGTGSYNVDIGNNTPSAPSNVSHTLRIGIHDGVNKQLLSGDFNTGTLDLGQANATSIIKTLGTTNSTSSTTGNVQISGGLGVAASLYANNLFNNHVPVYTDGSNNVQGLPTASGGFHTLEANKNYVVYGQITLTNGIQFGANNSVRGDGFSSTITFDETNSDIFGFRAVNQNMYVSQLTIVGGGGHFTKGSSTFLFDFNNFEPTGAGPSYGRNRRCKITNCNVIQARQLGRIIGGGTINITNNFFNGGGGAVQANDFYTINGFTVVVGLSLEFGRNKVVLFKGAQLVSSGIMLRIQGAATDDGPKGFNAVNVSGNIFHPRSTETGIFFEDRETQLGVVSSNTFIRTGGTAPLVLYPDQPTFDNYNVNEVKTYLLDNNTGIDNSEPELENQMTGSQSIPSNPSPTEITFLDNTKCVPLNRTKRWGVQMDLTGVVLAFVRGERISGVGEPNNALIIHADTLNAGAQTVYLCDFTGGFLSGTLGYSGTTSGSSTGIGTLRPRYRYCGNAPRQLSLSSSWNCTAGNNSTVQLFPGNGAQVDSDCESRTVTSASGVGSSMTLVCSRRYNAGDILNFYIQSSSGNVTVNRSVICVH